MGDHSRDPCGNSVLRGAYGSPAYLAALASLILLTIGTLAYPDTFVNVGLHVGSIRISPMSLLFVAAAPALSWFAFRNRSWIDWSILDILLITMLIFVTVRGAIAAVNGNQLGLVFALVAYVCLLYYGTAVVGQDSLQILYWVLVAMGIIAAVYALIEFALGRNVLYGDIIKEDVIPFPGKGYHRSGSILGAPGPLGIFMVQIAPFIIFFFVRAASKIKKSIWGAAMLLVALALLVTYGKGPWATAAILTFGGLAWLAWRKTAAARSLLLLLLVVVLGLGAFTLTFYNTVQSGTTSKARTSESTKPREYMWSRVPDTFLANPLVGAGLWQGNAEIFRVNPAPEYKNRPSSIDNIYLTALVEQGLIGVVLIVSTLWLIGTQGWKLLKNGGHAAQWGWPLAASMVGVMIAGLTSNDLMMWPNMVVFWLVAGMLRALAEKEKRKTLSDTKPRKVY